MKTYTIAQAKNEVVKREKRKNFQGELITKWEEWVPIYGLDDSIVNAAMKLYASKHSESLLKKIQKLKAKP